MSWRDHSQKTGMNAQPLGAPRRWGQEGPDGLSSPGLDGLKREREDAGADGGEYFSALPLSKILYGQLIFVLLLCLLLLRKGTRKRRSRWGDESSKVNLSGITTAITATNVSQTELDKYASRVRLEEINRKLASGDFVPNDRERSPSPPPTYDNQGRRTNTREVRYRKKLEDERAKLVEKTMSLDPNFKPPAEYQAYKRNQRPTEKVWLPLKEFPEINFFGLLVGPRGNTLKTMERESGAKISIRGKGSVKEGKGRPGYDDQDEEDMHCVVQADDEAKVKLCVRLINKVIETAASTPEGENDHKRNQLRELAALNGTLRDDENQVCQNCGKKGHRKYECPEERNWTAHIICHKCGQQGHLARDCTQGGPGGFGAPPGGPGPGPGMAGSPTGNGQFDSEYANLMAELGGGGGPGGPAPGPGGPPGASRPGPPQIGGAPPPGQPKIPPWRNPEVWMQPGAGRGAPRMGGMQGNGPYPAYGGAAGGYQQPAGYGQPGYQQPTGQEGYAGYQQQPAGNPQADPSAAAGQQDYSAQWAAYYAAQAQAEQGGGAAPAAPAAAAPAAGGQQDYSKEWAE